jgi:tetratricopeptide (TPR) repeat protein
MKKAAYLGAIIIVAAVSFTLGFVLGRRPRVERETGLDGVVLSASGNSRFPAEYRGAAAFLLEGKLSEAESVYNELAQRDQNSAEPYVGLAACRMKRNDLVGARELYDKALAKDTKSANALIGLGSVCGYQSDYTNAVAAYEKALRVNDEAAEAHWGLAQAYFYLGETDKARAHLNRFKQLLPNSPQIPALENAIASSPQTGAAPNAAPPQQ